MVLSSYLLSNLCRRILRPYDRRRALHTGPPPSPPPLSPFPRNWIDSIIVKYYFFQRPPPWWSDYFPGHAPSLLENYVRYHFKIMMKYTDAFEYDREFENKSERWRKRKVFVGNWNYNLYIISQSIENNYWILFQFFKNKKERDAFFEIILLNYSESLQINTKKRKNRQNSISKRTEKTFFFAKICEHEDPKKIQLFVFHCFETKVSPNVFNKRSLWESGDTWAPDRGQPIMRATFTPTISSRF